MEKTVILVHGLGLFGLEMIPLSIRLKKLGYDTKIFSYNPWRYTISECAKQLEEFLGDLSDSAVNFVGHSLGGFVISEFLTRNPKSNYQRVVNLGTPHCGSIAAKRLLKIPFGRIIIGKALTSSFDCGITIPESYEIGAIAGKFNLIFGWLLFLPRPNDTVVSLQEVKHPAIKDVLEVTATHASMLMLKRIAEQIDYFFQNGIFER
jgi:pimeloyl-ACP methyl ester carboxylesterase